MLLGDSSALYDIQKTSGLDIAANEIRTEWLKLQCGKISWMLLSYQNSNRLQLLSSGDGTIESFRSYLDSSSVVYGAFNVRLDTNQFRQVFLTFIGEAVTGMQRARVSMHRSAVNNYFEGSVLALALTDPAELQSAFVLRALAHCGFQGSSGGALGDVIVDVSSIDTARSDAVNGELGQSTRKQTELELLDVVLREYRGVSESVTTVSYPALGSVEPPEYYYWRVLQSQLTPCESLDLLHEYEERVLAQVAEVSNYIMHSVAELLDIKIEGMTALCLAGEQAKVHKPHFCLQRLLAVLAKLTKCSDDEMFRMVLDHATLHAVSAAWAELARCCRGTESERSISGNRNGNSERPTTVLRGEGPLLSLLLLAESIYRLADRAALPNPVPRLLTNTTTFDTSLIMKSTVINTDTQSPSPAASSTSLYTTASSVLSSEPPLPTPNPLAALLKTGPTATIPATNSAEIQFVKEISENTSSRVQSSSHTPNPVAALMKARSAATTPATKSAEALLTHEISENTSTRTQSSSHTPNPVAALIKARSAATLPVTNSAEAQLTNEISENTTTRVQSSHISNPVAALMKARSAVTMSPLPQTLLPLEEKLAAVVSPIEMTSAPAFDEAPQAQFERMLQCGVPEAAVRVKMERAGMPPELIVKLCPNTSPSRTANKPNQRRNNTRQSNQVPSFTSNSQTLGSKITMRRCFWDPISTDTGIEGTVFDSLTPSHNKLDPTRQFDTALSEPWGEVWVDGLKAAFTINIRKRELSEAERVGRAVGAIGGTLKKGSLTFMDQRRFNNIAIKLKQLRQTPEFLKRAVLTLDERFLTLDHVQALLQCSPSGDDLEAIAPYDGDPELLATVERFFYEVQHVPMFTRRIEAYRSRLELDGELVDYVVMAGHWSLACLRVGSSYALKQFVRLVLRIGNFLNSGGEDRRSTNTFAGPNSAETFDNSFDIHFLLKLIHVRSADLKTNLLRFILDRLHQDRPELLRALQDDLSSCREAAAINQKRLDASASNITRKIGVIRSVLTAIVNKYKSSRLDRPPEDLFETKMGLFLSRTELLFKSASRQANNAKQLYDRLVMYLGLHGSPGGTVQCSATLTAAANGVLSGPGIVTAAMSSGDNVFSLLLDTASAIAAARAASEEASKNEQRRVKQAEVRVEALRKRAAAVERRRAKEQAEAEREAAGELEGHRIHPVIGERTLSSVGRLQSVKSVYPSKQQLLQGEILLARHRMKARGNTRPYSDFDPIPKNNGSGGGSSSAGDMVAPATSALQGLKKKASAGRTRRVDELRFGPLSVSPACVAAWSKVQSTGQYTYSAYPTTETSPTDTTEALFMVQPIGPSPTSTFQTVAATENMLTDTTEVWPKLQLTGSSPSSTSTFPTVAALETSTADTVNALQCSAITQAPATQAIADGVNWLVAKLLPGPSGDGDTARLELVATGAGGFAEMQTWLAPASVNESDKSKNCDGVAGAISQVTLKKWTAKELLSLEKGSLGCAVGVCRIMASDGDSRRVKLVAVYLVDDSLPNRTRVFASTLKRHVQSFLLGVHVEFTVGGGSELSKEEVVKHLLAAGGAHAPKTFEF